MLSEALTDHPLVPAAECAAVRDRVLGLCDRWIDRTPDRTFCTLGAAAYLDFHPRRADRPSYYDLAAAQNPVLAAAFGELLAAVRARLSRILGGAVAWSPRCALPGFHVFRGRGLRRAGIAGGAFDGLFAGLDLPMPTPATAVSFTLPIALPAAGGGLEVWTAASDAPCRIHPYRVGTLTIHRGHLLHQIAPTPDAGPTDERITLQGHAVRARDTWIAYW